MPEKERAAVDTERNDETKRRQPEQASPQVKTENQTPPDGSGGPKSGFRHDAG